MKASKPEPITRSEVAAASGYDASLVSRLLSEDRSVTAEHVSALVRALPDDQDRRHCVLEFLYDQCPPEYRSNIFVAFSDQAVQEPRPRPADSLSRNLGELERAATENPDLRKLLGNLASLLGDEPDAKSAGGAKLGK